MVYKPTVAIVDDDGVLTLMLDKLLSALGMRVEVFSTAADFPEAHSPDINCLVLDVRLPDKNGLELYQDLTRNGLRAPAIIISGYADVHMSVRAMKAGAFDFLTKPLGEQDFVDAVQAALRRDKSARHHAQVRDSLLERFEQLTARERELMKSVVAGSRNKAIARDMGVSEITVKTHRSQMMKKMMASSVPALVAMSQLLELSYADPLALISGASRYAGDDD